MTRALRSTSVLGKVNPPFLGAEVEMDDKAADQSVEIACPRCGLPRVANARCPHCGDTPTDLASEILRINRAIAHMAVEDRRLASEMRKNARLLQSALQLQRQLAEVAAQRRSSVTRRTLDAGEPRQSPVRQSNPERRQGRLGWLSFLDGLGGPFGISVGGSSSEQAPLPKETTSWQRLERLLAEKYARLGAMPEGERDL